MFFGKVLVLIALLAVVSEEALTAPSDQQGPKLAGTDPVGKAHHGRSVALSADGNTAIVGGYGDNSNVGAVWVYTRTGEVWNQQGEKLVGSGAVGHARQGWSVALSADGNTAIVGGYADSSTAGAAWIFTRTGGVWSQQGEKLVGTGAMWNAFQGISVAISGDGNTAIVGGSQDFSGNGAVWVYTRSGGVWSQQGAKLAGTGGQGWSVALSADGNTAIVGAMGDVSGVGAARVFTRSGGVWSQQYKLVGYGVVGNSNQGSSVALSADGNTAIVGGYGDNSSVGAAWIFTRTGASWRQQGTKLVGSGAVGPPVAQGYSVALSGDGNTAVLGGYADSSSTGAAWVFTRDGAGEWSQSGPKLVGSGATGIATQGISVALSGDGGTAILGGDFDDSTAGAAWVFVSRGGSVGVGGSAGGGTGVAFALDPPVNPAMSGRMMVSFSLPSGDPARLELVDVSGREEAAVEVGSLGAGRHTVDLTNGRRLPAGVYFVRLSQGSRVARTRVAVLN